MTDTGLKLYFASNSGGAFNVWMLDYPNGTKPRQVTRFPYSPAGARMPDRCGYTKFALTADSLIVPVETRRSEILVLEQKVNAEVAGK